MEGLLRTHHCGEIRSEDINQEVILAGWVNKYRDLGGLHFLDIRDKYGVTQLSFEDFKDDLSILKKCSLESVILAKGKVSRRPDNALNKKMETGEVELKVSSLEILSRSDIDNIPFLPFGEVSAQDDLRLKYRYLDLRTKKLQDVLRTRSQITMNVRNYLTGKDFIEVETPLLYKSTPEGARDYIVPSRVHPGHVYALPQSPQTLKQLLMIGGTDKYFQICRCFRDEDLRHDRQPEFSQIDIEVSFATQDYIKNLVEGLVQTIFGFDSDFSVPKMSYKEAMEQYGCDKPDVRFGLAHLNVTSLFKDSPFSLFSSVAATDRGLIKALFVPIANGKFSRKDTDGLTDIVKPHGGKGVAFYKVEGGNRSAGISKFITDELHEKIEELSENSGDGTWFFFADNNPDTTHSCADAVRRFLGKKLNLIKEGYKFLWIYDFPLLEWSDRDGGRFVAKHHPFTLPKNEEIDKFLASDWKKDKDLLRDMPAEAYDLVCNGYELGGGSLRIHRDDIQNKMFEVLGISEEEKKKQFGFFIEALKYGTPPHGGVALGLDRVLMILKNTESIRDVIAFPKTNSAADLMSASPSIPGEEQLKELSFKWDLDKK